MLVRRLLRLCVCMWRAESSINIINRAGNNANARARNATVCTYMHAYACADDEQMCHSTYKRATYTHTLCCPHDHHACCVVKPAHISLHDDTYINILVGTIQYM